MSTKNKVLVVDDSEEQRQLCAEFLELEFEVFDTGNPEQVLEIIEREKIDVVVTDLVMPDKDGFDVINDINRTYTEIPAIVLTGYASKENLLSCLRSGAFDLLEKPVKPDYLIDAVNRASEYKILLDKRYKWTVAQFCHEISTPITGVLMMSKLIINKLNRSPTEGEWLNEVKQKMQKSLQLTVRISDIIKESKLSLVETAKKMSNGIFLIDIIRDALGVCDHILQGIDVHIDGVDEEIRVSCYRVRLTQAVINIVKNAVQAIEQYEEKWLKLSTKELDDAYELSIIDCGKGIKSEIREKIFKERFTTKSVDRGTGFGLHIARKIIEDHGGEIDIDPNHENTRFFMRIPKK